jgi:MFS family permease
MSAEPYPDVVHADQTPQASSLSSLRGVAILLLLSLVQFMDILDASILNIALPSIKGDLGFSQQGLQWVVNGYILTYGGFLLLGGRMADLLGRRRILVTGLLVFAGSSLIGGLAHSSSLLIGARFAQGLGAAMLSPAALSTLSSTFRATRDRNTALGVGRPSPASAAPPGSSSAVCSPRGRAGAGCCSSTSPSVRLLWSVPSSSSSGSARSRGWPTSTRSGPSSSPAGCCFWSTRS